MKVYQINKSQNKYWWTGTIETDKIPNEDGKYRWALNIETAKALSGTNIN